MENYRLPIWIASILGCALIIFVALLTVHQFQQIRGDSQLLSVSATAKAEAVPDLAVVTVGVVSEGTTAQAVKNQNSSKMNQVISFIKQTGIEDKDIKTSQFNISPKYNYNNQQQTLVGYQANQTITIKVRNIDKSSQQLDTLVDGAVMNGANQIQGVDFSFEDDDALMQNARKQAIHKAKTNAFQISKDAGIKLGRVVNVITSAGDNPTPMFATNFALAKAAAPQIERGSQAVVATVTVVFEIS
jgi:uncharacterized protein YggE